MLEKLNLSSKHLNGSIGPTTSQLLQSITQYKHYLSMLKSGNMQDEQKQYVSKLIRNLLNKIDIDALPLTDYLLINDLEQVDVLIKLLINFIQEIGRAQLRSSYLPTPAMPIIKCQDYQPKLKKLKQSIGIAETPIHCKQNHKTNIDIKQELSDDGYLQKMDLHIANITYYQDQLMATMQKQILGKAYLYLSEDNAILNGIYGEVEENKNLFREIQIEIKDFQNINAALNTNTRMEKLAQLMRMSVCRAVFRILTQIQKKKLIQKQSSIREFSTQTALIPQFQKIKHLQLRYEELVKQVTKIKNAKKEVDKQLYQCKQMQFQHKIKIDVLEKERQNLGEKLKKQIINYETLGIKCKNQVGIKTNEIAKLEKTVQELKFKVFDLENFNVNLKQELKRYRQRRGTIQRMLERQPSINTKTRQSVELSIAQEQIESRSTMKPLGRRSGFDSSKTEAFKQLRLTQRGTFNVFQLRSEQMKQKIQQQKLQRLDIYQQYSMAIESRRQENFEDGEIVQIGKAILAKKAKTLRMVKSSRKQNLLRNLQQQKRSNFNTTAASISGFSKQAKIKSRLSYQQQMQKQVQQHSDDKKFLRLQIQMHNLKQISQKDPEPILNNNKSVERLKNGFVMVRKYKSKNKNNKTDKLDIKSDKSIMMLPQMGAEYLQIFGGEKSAYQYEKNTGIWSQLYFGEKLALDFQNTSYCNGIQKYFTYLEQSSSQKYQQFITFLTRPLTYVQAKRKNQQIPFLQAINISQVKQIFTKLIRFHKVMHKGCNHVSEFLETIGYFEL